MVIFMESDDLARSLLENLGYDVFIIPPSNIEGKKEADFIISLNSYSALVEAKLKKDDPKEYLKREDTLESGSVYCSNHTLGRNETISGIIGNAARQLRSSTDKEHNFRVLFFIANCINAKVVSEQFIDTIYGRTEIIELENHNTTKKCYFYRNSDFYRRNIIDAAIVGYKFGQDVHLKICLNTYSENYEFIKNSGFISPFGASVVDPLTEESLGLAYIPDKDIERKENEFSKVFPFYDPVLIHLSQKYHTGRLIKADFNCPEISIRHPVKDIS